MDARMLAKKVIPSATTLNLKNFLSITMVLTLVCRLKNIARMKGVMKSRELIILNITTTIGFSTMVDFVYFCYVTKSLNAISHG